MGQTCVAVVVVGALGDSAGDMGAVAIAIFDRGHARFNGAADDFDGIHECLAIQVRSGPDAGVEDSDRHARAGPSFRPGFRRLHIEEIPLIGEEWVVGFVTPPGLGGDAVGRGLRAVGNESEGVIQLNFLDSGLGGQTAQSLVSGFARQHGGSVPAPEDGGEVGVGRGVGGQTHQDVIGHMRMIGIDRRAHLGLDVHWGIPGRCENNLRSDSQ